MRFLVDNQLPPALARFIQADLGTDAVHVADVGLRDASDREVWSYASLHGFILISKDEDFAEAYFRQPAAQLLWVRLGNCRRVFLLDVFRRAWPRIIARFEGGDGFVELR